MGACQSMQGWKLLPLVDESLHTTPVSYGDGQQAQVQQQTASSKQQTLDMTSLLSTKLTIDDTWAATITFRRETDLVTS